MKENNLNESMNHFLESGNFGTYCAFSHPFKLIPFAITNKTLAF
jgi:hypothetical protein